MIIILHLIKHPVVNKTVSILNKNVHGFEIIKIKRSRWAYNNLKYVKYNIEIVV